MHLTIEKVLLLKAVPIFSEAQEEDLIEVAEMSKEIEIQAGHRIIRKGDLGRSLYVIIDGLVRVHDDDIEVTRLESGDVFGELAALDPEPRNADVSAVTDCRLFEIDEETIYTLINERIAVARSVIRVLCRRIRAMPPQSRSPRSLLAGRR